MNDELTKLDGKPEEGATPEGKPEEGATPEGKPEEGATPEGKPDDAATVEMPAKGFENVTDAEQLKQMALSEDDGLRLIAAASEHTPDYEITLLAKDHNWDVRSKAVENAVKRAHK